MPPPLQFDVEENEGDDADVQEEKDAASAAGVTIRDGDVPVEVDDDDDAIGPTSKPDLKRKPPPAKPLAPPKDEEYIWQWKAELETSRKTFFL